MLRLSTSVVVMRPALALPIAEFGNPNPGWLKRLNASQRNSTSLRPKSRNRFDSDVSKLT